MSIRSGGRLAEIGDVFSIGTVGGSFDKALTHNVNEFYKPELVRSPEHPAAWKTVEDLELGKFRRVSYDPISWARELRKSP